MPPLARKKAVPLFILLGVLAAAGGGWWLLSDRPARLNVVAVGTGPVIQAVYATGTVEPVTWARVEPLQAARIAEIAVREGQRVTRGELLARLDPVEHLANLASLEAGARFLEAELDRQRQLARRGIAAPQALERAESELSQARARMEAERQRLETFALRTPIDGVILRRDGELGEIARPGEPLFWVGQPQPLWAVVEVDEEDIPLVRAEQSALIKADAFPSQPLDGTVAEITPKGDPVNKTYRVRIALPTDTPLRIGMTVEANIIVRREERALLVPETALVGGGEGNYVFVVEGGTARAVPVDVGVVAERAEIRNGLAAGQRVIAEPPAGLADGDPVRPRREPG